MSYYQEVNLDWPPTIDEAKIENVNSISITIEKQVEFEEMDASGLEKLLEKGLEFMNKAQSTPRGDTRQDLYMGAKKSLEKAHELVEKLGLFSDNEAIEDVPTADVKYMIIPAHLAKVLISAETGPNRLQVFQQAESYLKQFLTRVVNYGLGSSNIETAIKSSDCEMTATPVGRNDSLEAAARSRNEKIENYKKMKMLESRLEELERRVKSGQNVDDEEVREYHLKLLDKYINESYESLEREVKPALFFERNRASQQGSSSGDIVVAPDLNNPADRMPIDPTKSVTIVRDALQKQVFGIGYPSRPTVTVDEFISEKIESGDLAFQKHKAIYANSLQRYAEQPTLLRDQEETSDTERELKEEKDDADELNRKRRWDEFKDENKRGSGNRHNMG